MPKVKRGDAVYGNSRERGKRESSRFWELSQDLKDVCRVTLVTTPRICVSSSCSSLLACQPTGYVYDDTARQQGYERRNSMEDSYSSLYLSCLLRSSSAVSFRGSTLSNNNTTWTSNRAIQHSQSSTTSTIFYPTKLPVHRLQQ